MMKFKIYDHANGVMYMDAENIDDPKWNFARLHHNIHCTTCVSLNKYGRNGTLIFEYDLLKIHDIIFYVSPLKDGKTFLRGLNSNIVEELTNFKEEEITVLGSYLELERNWNLIWTSTYTA